MLIDASPSRSETPAEPKLTLTRGRPELPSRREADWGLEPDGRTSLQKSLGPVLVERLMLRASVLQEEEQALLRALYQDGRSSKELAQLTGTDARSVRRRVRRIATRVLSKRFSYVLQHRDQWCSTRRRVATVVVLQGRSMREASEVLRLSLHTVRRHYHAIEAMWEGAEE